MSARRAPLYSATSVPTAEAIAYTSASNTHIDKATVFNGTGSAVDITIKLAGVTVYGAKSIPSSTDAFELSGLVNHGLSATQTITVLASAANVEMLISGRDF